MRAHDVGHRVRIVVTLDTDTSKTSPRELREHSRVEWLAAIDRARAAGRIELAVAEELVRAWPAAEQRR